MTGSENGVLVSFRYGVARGVGIMSGLILRRIAEPVTPTAAERMKPGLERSMRCQRKGLTRASVSDACSADAHGSFRCRSR